MFFSVYPIFIIVFFMSAVKN